MRPCAMPAIGPKYLPCRVITAWRCFTRTSGLACASASPLNTATARPAAKRLIFITFSMGWTSANTGKSGLFPLAQSGSVLRHRADFAIRQTGGNPAHRTVGVVRPAAFAEELELGCQVLGVLAREPGILAGQASAGRAVAARAGRYSGRGVAAAPDLLAKRREVLV